MQPYQKSYNINNIMNKHCTSSSCTPQDLEDEPLPMDYNDKLKSIASLNNQNNKKGFTDIKPKQINYKSNVDRYINKQDLNKLDINKKLSNNNYNINQTNDSLYIEDKNIINKSINNNLKLPNALLNDFNQNIFLCKTKKEDKIFEDKEDEPKKLNKLIKDKLLSNTGNCIDNSNILKSNKSNNHNKNITVYDNNTNYSKEKTDLHKNLDYCLKENLSYNSSENYDNSNVINNFIKEINLNDKDFKCIKTGNMQEACVKPRKGDITPKSLNSNDSKNNQKFNHTNKLPNKLDNEKSENLSFSDLEENTNLDKKLIHKRRNTTMSEIKKNINRSDIELDRNENNISKNISLINKDGLYTKNNASLKIFNNIDFSKHINFQEECATIPTKSLFDNSNLLINNNNQCKKEDTKTLSDNTQKFIEYRKHFINNNNNNNNINNKNNIDNEHSKNITQNISEIINIPDHNSENNNSNKITNDFTYQNNLTLNNNSNSLVHGNINITNNNIYTSNNLKTQNSSNY